MYRRSYGDFQFNYQVSGFLKTPLDGCRLYIININTTAIDCLWIVTHFRHAPYGRRHFVPSAVSLAAVYASPAKPALNGVESVAGSHGPAFCRYRNWKASYI